MNLCQTRRDDEVDAKPLHLLRKAACKTFDVRLSRVVAGDSYARPVRTFPDLDTDMPFLSCVA